MALSSTKYPVLLLFLLFSIQGFSQISRNQAVENASVYTSFEWNADTCNLWNGISCGGRNVFAATCWVIPGINTSMPYMWGGWSTVNDFREAMSNCKSAGDVCSADCGGGCSGGGSGLNHECAGGHDCSGLVSRAWALSSKQSTYSLPGFSSSIPLTETQPGDILNLTGSHTRLIETNYNNGNYRVIEASGIDWKTSYRTYSAIQLTSYTPLCPNATIIEGGCNGTPPENDNCLAAYPITPDSICVYTTGDVYAATASGLARASCDAYGNPSLLDVWFRFIATDSSAKITVEPSSGMDAVVALYESCGGAEAGCADSGGGNGKAEYLNASGLITGNTYYIRIYDYGSAAPSTTTFQLCIQSNKVVVAYGNQPEFRIYPNPAFESINIEGKYLEKGFYDLELLGINGNRLLLQSYEVKDGEMIITLELANLLPGIYFIRITSGTFSKIMKIGKLD